MMHAFVRSSLHFIPSLACAHRHYHCSCEITSPAWLPGCSRWRDEVGPICLLLVPAFGVSSRRRCTVFRSVFPGGVLCRPIRRTSDRAEAIYAVGAASVPCLSLAVVVGLITLVGNTRAVYNGVIGPATPRLFSLCTTSRPFA